MALRDQLQTTLGSGYTVERELGGGGMSHVFLARDETLRRNVVVKVLPPDLIAGVNVERFNREIELAAGLQHPHIVPVLSAGQTDGLPYYTMPFVEGESLRARLVRSGSLPITEAIGYLRDVAKALAYAHERGVVHRDIKPDNVLISGGSATVTDFGIAKALAAAQRGGLPGAPATGQLTVAGLSIGTPAYMSPEQATGDPAIDHRADLYSFGCLAFELLTGRPPFLGKTPQRLLVEHMTETPPPVATLRLDTPLALGELVDRCLEKDASRRPQSASDIVRVLETVTSGGGSPAMPAILLGGPGMLRKALVVYAIAFLVVAIVARAAIVAIGLPDWVFPGALIVMALGLPAILFTAYVNHATRRAITETPTYTPGGTPSMTHGTMATIALKASPHMSWRRTAFGGAGAVGAFVLIIGGYMLVRGMGIGPFGSLLAAGTLATNEKVLVADFPSPPNDTTLGPVVTEAFRTALGQSQSVNVLQQTAMQNALRRMRMPTTTPVDFAVARQIASRDGIRAVVVGNLLGLGGRYQLSVKLMSSQAGDVLAELSESANSTADLLPAIDKLAKHLRARIGESLKHVQATPPLEQVTTPSLEALRKYVAGAKLVSVDGDVAKGIALLEEAVSLDTGFAMAYRKLGLAYANRALFEKSIAALNQAYAHKDRLSDAERYLVTATYFDNSAHQDVGKSEAAYEQLLDIQPNNTAALNNLANIYKFRRDYAKAAAMYARAVRVGPVAAVHYQNLVHVTLSLGKIDEAQRTIGEFAKAFPMSPMLAEARINVYWVRRQYDSVQALIDSTRPQFSGDPATWGGAMIWSADIARLRGRIAEARRLNHEGWRLMGSAGSEIAGIEDAANDAVSAALLLGDSAGAVRTLDDSLARHSLDSVEKLTDPFARTEWAYALANRVDKARAVLARWEDSRKRFSSGDDSLYRHGMNADIAFAERKYDVALREYRAGDVIGCLICNLPQIGRTYDLLGNADSAIAVFARFVDTPAPARSTIDGLFLAGIHKRLGELYEAKGDRQNAISHYTTFVELWKNADPPLQPKVAEVKAKLARLSKQEGKS